VNTYYLVDKRGTHKLTGKKDLLEAREYDEKVKSFNRNDKLKFNEYRFEENLIRALIFYESLN